MERFSGNTIQMTVEGHLLSFEICYDYMKARGMAAPYPKYVYGVKFLGAEPVTIQRNGTTLVPSMRYTLKGVNLKPDNQRNPAYRDYNELFHFRGDHLRELVAVDDDGWNYVTTAKITSPDNWCMLLEQEMDCNLRDWLQRYRRKSSIRDRLDLFYQICCGEQELLYGQAERTGLPKVNAHLDIKAENALMQRTPTGWQIRLSDFATILIEGSYTLKTTISSVILSINSTPPEIVDGLNTLTVASDLYALGTLLIQLFSNENPIQAWIRCKSAECLNTKADRRETLRNAFLELSQIRPTGSAWLFEPLRDSEWCWDVDTPNSIRRIAEQLVEYDPERRTKFFSIPTLLGTLESILDDLQENEADYDAEEDMDDFFDWGEALEEDCPESTPAASVYLINGSYSMQLYGGSEEPLYGPLYRAVTRAMEQDRLDRGEAVQCYAVVYYADEGDDTAAPRPLGDKSSGTLQITNDTQLRERLCQIEYRDGGLEPEDNVCDGISWINQNTDLIPNLDRVHIFTDYFALQDRQLRLTSEIKTLRANYGDVPFYCHTPQEPDPGSGFDIINREDRPTVYYIPMHCIPQFEEIPPKDGWTPPEEEEIDPRDCFIQGSRIREIYEETAFFKNIAKISGQAYRTFVIDRRLTTANGSNSIAYLSHEEDRPGTEVMLKELYPRSLSLHRSSRTHLLEIDSDDPTVMETIHKVQKKFETEKTLLQGLQSARIPTANCLIADGENRYLIMQYCAGTQTLKTICQRLRSRLQALPIEHRQPSLFWTKSLLQILYILADVVAQLHAYGIAHNDLVLDNALVSDSFPELDETLRVYLIDFSEARRRVLDSEFETAVIRDNSSFSCLINDCFQIAYGCIPNGWQTSGIYARLLDESTAATTMENWRDLLGDLLRELHVDVEPLREQNRVFCTLPEAKLESESDGFTRPFDKHTPGAPKPFPESAPSSADRFELVIGGKVIR